MTHRRVFLPLCAVLAGVSAFAQSEERQRRVVSDFEDAGTWRMIGNSGATPGAWFSGVTWMGGSQNARFADDWTGEIRFDFAAETTASRRLAFRRVKMAQTSGFLDGIEFDADSRGHPVRLRFILIDSLKKRHTTPAVTLGPEGWRRHRLELGEKSWPGVKSVRFPAAVEQVLIESDVGGAGAVFIDDLALTGSFSRRDRLTVVPVYERIAYEPGKPLGLAYRVRNALGSSVGVGATLVVRSVAGEEVFSGKAHATVAAFGKETVAFSLPALPVGAYEARLELEAGDLSISYDDTFGVFTPNGGRVNRKPMWFGIQDLTAWQGEGENRLHMDWMKQIGFDINRPGMTAGRFSQEVPLSHAGWRNLLQPFEEAGIDSVLMYFETPPSLTGEKKDIRAAPTDLDAFEKYAAEVGAFFGKEFPRVRYIEFWNEPDLDFFHGTIGEYWGMFRAFSRGVRSSAPWIKIGTGGSSVKHPREKAGFSESLYSENGDSYDVAIFHAHGTLGAYVERQEMVEAWQRKGGLEKPFANTESGERSGYDPRGRAEQATTLVKKMAYSKSRPRSEFHIWFTLQDYWDMDPAADDSFGLVTSDNRAKPSLVAYNELIRQLANTEPAPTPALPSEITGHAFVRDDGRHVLVCWAGEGSGGGALWLRSDGAITRGDMFGLTERLAASAGVAVAVGKEPLYLVSDGPLSLLKDEDLPLRVPSEIQRDAEQPVEFKATVRNMATVAALNRLVLRDAQGGVVWSGEREIPAGAQADFAVRIKAGASAGDGTRRYRIELSTAGGEALAALPVLVHDSYAIGKGVSKSLRLSTAQDVHELTFDPTIPAWKNPRDLSVDARIGRDDAAVIFRFDVTDDKHVQTHPDAQLWRGDSVQVAFYNPENGAHTLFDLGLRGEEAVAWCHKNADASRQGRWTLPLSIRREGSLTAYEIAVPFSWLGLPENPVSGASVRFAFLVNEDDGQGRVRWMNWRGGLGKNQDARQLGHGILK